MKIMTNSDEEDFSDDDSAPLQHIPGFGEELDVTALRELTDVGNSKLTNWRSIDADIALVEEVEKASAHLASQGKVVKKFKHVQNELNLRG
jgi:hypothetical protein